MARKAWQPGDPVGCGPVYLPTRDVADAYARACLDAILTADARAICAIPEIATRRARIAMYPEKHREALKARVRELWNK